MTDHWIDVLAGLNKLLTSDLTDDIDVHLLFTHLAGCFVGMDYVFLL